MTLIKRLKILGLTDKEARVYLALVELYKDTVMNIANKSKVGRSIAYTVLNSLIEKGLCSIQKEGKKTLYMAENPITLSNLLSQQKAEFEEKNHQLEETLDELGDIFNLQDKDKPFVRFFEGRKGLSPSRDEFFQRQEYTVRSIFPLDGYQGEYHDKDREKTHKNRIKNKIYSKCIYSSDLKTIESDKTRELMKLISKDYGIKADIMVGDDKVRMVAIKDNYPGIVVYDKEICETMQTLFDLAWIGIQHMNENKDDKPKQIIKKSQYV